MDTPRHDTRAFASVPRRWCPWRRLGAVALVTFRQGLRLRLWLLAPVALVIAIVTDLSSPRFAPVFDAIPAAVGTSLVAMTVLATVVSLFFATYATPAEMDSKVSYLLMTKPVGRWEIVAGKIAGLTLLLATMLAMVGAGAYVYTLIRAGDIQALAARRLVESRPRAARPADLNPLEAVAKDGPLATYRYRRAAAGPDFQVLFAGTPPSDPGVVWVVGQSGMRLRWDLSSTPLRKWLATGPGRLQVTVVPHASAGADEVSVEAVIRLVVRQPGDDAGTDVRRRDEDVQRLNVPVPANGLLDVPLVRPQTPPPEHALTIPDQGNLFLEVLATRPQDVLGARAEAVRMVWPGGRTHTMQAEPLLLPSTMNKRRMLVGRPEPPRQVALFRFDEVPERLLGDGDTAVEIGFTLDAFSAATVPSAAQATFIRPDTGESRAFRFTPEGHHPTLLYVDEAFWHGGPLLVRLECLTADDYIGLVPESVRLRLQGDPYVVHLAKGVFSVLLFGTVLMAAAVLVSTRLSWFVSILGMVTLLAVGTVGQTLLGYGAVGPSAYWLASRIQQAPGGDWLLGHVQLQGLLPEDSFTMGEAIAWWDLGASTALVLAVTAVCVAVGAYVLRSREVAA